MRISRNVLTTTHGGTGPWRRDEVADCVGLMSIIEDAAHGCAIASAPRRHEWVKGSLDEAQAITDIAERPELPPTVLFWQTTDSCY